MISSKAKWYKFNSNIRSGRTLYFTRRISFFPVAFNQFNMFCATSIIYTRRTFGISEVLLPPQSRGIFGMKLESYDIRHIRSFLHSKRVRISAWGIRTANPKKIIADLSSIPSHVSLETNTRRSFPRLSRLGSILRIPLGKGLLL